MSNHWDNEVVNPICLAQLLFHMNEGQKSISSDYFEGIALFHGQCPIDQMEGFEFWSSYQYVPAVHEYDHSYRLCYVGVDSKEWNDCKKDSPPGAGDPRITPFRAAFTSYTHHGKGRLAGCPDALHRLLFSDGVIRYLGAVEDARDSHSCCAPFIPQTATFPSTPQPFPTPDDAAADQEHRLRRPRTVGAQGLGIVGLCQPKNCPSLETQLAGLKKKLAAKDAKLTKVTHERDLLLRENKTVYWQAVAVTTEKNAIERDLTLRLEDAETENEAVNIECQKLSQQLYHACRERDGLAQALRQQMAINTQFNAMYAAMEVAGDNEDVEEMDVILAEVDQTDVDTGDAESDTEEHA